MADVNANIGINIDTSQSLAEIKNLQRQLAQLYTSINRGSAAAAAAQKGLATNLMNTINAGGKFYAQMGTIRTSTESFTHALEKNKLTMREYFRFAGGSTRTFGRLFKSEFDTIGRVAEERVKKMQTQYVKLGRDASGAMRAISITPTSLNMKDYGNQIAVAAQKQAILNQVLRQGSTNLLNFGKNTQWAGRQLMVGFTIPLAYFGTAAAKTFMDLEAQAIKFRRVYGDMFTTTEDTNRALADIGRLAQEFTKYGVAVSQTMEMAAKAAAMGKTGAELTAQVAEATRLAVLGGVEQDQALDTTISLTNAFGLAAEDLAQKIDFLNAVENQTVTAIEDLTIAIPKAGPVVQQLGGSVEDLAFFLTAMREGGINASEGANALKSGLASLINPTDKAAGMLADLGINIKAIVESNVGNLRQTVIDFAKALDTLAPLERSRAIEQLFGKFQFARLSTLFENVTKDGGQAARVLDLAGKSVEELAILSERELGAIEDAIGTNFKESVEQLKLAIAPIGKEFLKAITPVVKFLGDLFEKFNNLSDGSKKFIVILTALVGLVGPTLLMTFGLLANGVANIIKLFILMRQGFLKVTGNATNLAAQTQYLNSEQMEAAVVAASLNQAHTRLTQQFTLEASAVMALRDAYIQATTAAARFAATNPGMMMPGFKGKGPIKGGGTSQFSTGTTEVLGGVPGKDSVPSLLTPGEAVVPAGIAQDDRFKPLIAALVSGDIAKYNDGTTEVRVGDQTFNARDAKNNKVVKDILDKFVYDNRTNTFTYTDPQKPERSGTFSSQRLMDVLNNRQSGNELNWTNVQRSLNIGSGMRGSGISSNKDPKIQKLVQRGVENTALYTKEDFYLKRALKNEGIQLTQGQSKDLRDGQTFKSVAAHINPLLTRDESGIKVFDPKNLIADKQFVNNYVQGLGRSSNLQKLLEMSDKDFANKLAIPFEKTREYRFELAKLQLGYHPTRPISADALARVAAHEYSLTKNPYAFLTSKAMEFRLKEGFYGSKMMPFLEKVRREARVRGKFAVATRPNASAKEAMRSKIVLAMNGEYLNDNLKKKSTKITPAIGREKLSTEKGGGPRDKIAVNTDPKTQTITHQPVYGPRGLAARMIRRPSAQNEFPSNASATTLGLKSGGAPGVTTSKIEENYRRQSSDLVDNTEKAGRSMTGVSVAASALIVGLGFLDGAVGEVAQKLLPLAFILPMITSEMGKGLLRGLKTVAAKLFATPLGLFVTTVVATIAAAKYFSNKNEEAAKAISKFVDATSATTGKMKQIGEITGEVGASQIVEKRGGLEVADKFSRQFERAGQQFGTTFLESEVGKEIAKGFTDNLLVNRTTAIEKFASQLAQYVSDGVLTGIQAENIASNIAVQFGDMSLEPQIRGELMSLIGPDGKDLLANPLGIRVILTETERGFTKDITKNLQTEMKNVASGFGGVVPKESFGYLFGTTQAESLAAAGAAQSVQALETNRAQVAAISVEYEEQIRKIQSQVDALNIKAQKETLTSKEKEKQAKLENTILGLNRQREKGIETLRSKDGEILKDQEKLFDILQKQGHLRESYFASLKEQAKLRFKDTDMAPFVDPVIKAAQGFSDALGKEKGRKLEIKIDALLASGTNPMLLMDLITMYKGKEEKLDKVLSVSLETHGVDNLLKLTSGLGFIKSKKVKRDLIANLMKSDPEQFDDIQSTLILLNEMDLKEVNLNVIFGGNAEESAAKLKALIERLNEIEALPDPLTKEALLKITRPGPRGRGEVTPEYIKGIINDWDWIKSLPAKDEKLAVLRYVSIWDTITNEEVKAEKEKMLAEAEKVGGLAGKAIAKGIATEAAMERITKRKLRPLFTPETVPQEKGKVPKDKNTGGKDPYEDLNKKLRTLRDFSISAAGGLGQLQKLFAGDKSITKFSGSLQDLARGPSGGINRAFIDYLSDLDQATFMSLINQKKFKKGTLELNDTGRILKDTFGAIDLGTYQSQFQVGAENTLAQQSAFIKLKNAGLDTFTALELVANEALAVELNSAKADGSIKGLVDSFKAAENATKKFNIELERSLISDIRDFELLKQMPNLVDQMKKLGLNADQIKTVLDDPQLAKGLINDLEDGKVDSELIAEYLNSIPSKKVVQIDLQMKTAEGQYDIFKQGFGEAMDFFDAQEALIELDRAPGLKEITDEIERQEKAIADAETKIQGYQNTIDDLQFKLDYDPEFGARAIDSLKEEIEKERKEIEKLNDEIDGFRSEIEKRQRNIELNFERPIQALQDESNVLSNTLTLIEQQEDSINKKYDVQVQALEQVSSLNQDILDQQKSQLDVAGALSQGDIAAAARAAQEARAQAASRAQKRAGGVLDAARQAELGRVSVDGMTREQIDQRQFQIGQQIFKLEQDRKVIDAEILFYQDEIYKKQQAQIPFQQTIKDLEEQIEAKEKQRSVWTKEIANNQFEIDRITRESIEPAQLLLEKAELARDAYIKQTEKLFESLDYLGKTKKEWEETNTRIEAAKTAGENLAKVMEHNASIVSSIAANWKSIESKTVTLTVHTIYTSSGSSGTDTTKKDDSKRSTGGLMYGGRVDGYMGGGKVRKMYMAAGGAVGSDTVPAMLTPGEYVVNKASSKAFAPFLTAINESKYPSVLANKISDARPIYQIPIQTSLNQPSYNISTPVFNTSASNMANASYNDNSSAVYNYSVGISVGGTNASPETVAKAVMNEIKYLDSQRVKNQKVS